MINNNAFCTIITSNYMHYALALNESLQKQKAGIPFYIFVTDKNVSVIHWQEKFPNIVFLFNEDLCASNIGKSIMEKYISINMDAFRWSMKGVLMTHLLEVRGIDKVIFVDCDIYFFNDFDFLFNDLSENSILLTPHWRCAINPELDPLNFDYLFTHGLYNAGFIGANQKGVPALKQLAKWCLYQCKNDLAKKMLDDQTYLNLLPIYFEGVKILKHKGCNIAGWNLIECKREKVDNQVLIEGKYEVVFIHFLATTIQLIHQGFDLFLQPHLERYLQSLQKYQPKINFYQHYKLDIVDKEIVAILNEKILQQEQVILNKEQTILSQGQFMQDQEKNFKQIISENEKIIAEKNNNLKYYAGEVKKQEQLSFLLRKIGNYFYNKIFK